ncbi:hypothetical protein QYE76_010198 [Lolium multiflorum]|uniref:Uncharacterized protein n=1 Tax=Lolium multiflorum TaxID=4521 RepID=A0AAD8TT75_LOLMU|nr:hypothetical protein QYE76_010198 [Lolium multiflorum]
MASEKGREQAAGLQSAGDPSLPAADEATRRRGGVVKKRPSIKAASCVEYEAKRGKGKQQQHLQQHGISAKRASSSLSKESKQQRAEHFGIKLPFLSIQVTSGGCCRWCTCPGATEMELKRTDCSDLRDGDRSRGLGQPYRELACTCLRRPWALSTAGG